jgi:hypothetical protein
MDVSIVLAGSHLGDVAIVNHKDLVMLLLELALMPLLGKNFLLFWMEWSLELFNRQFTHSE